MQITTLVVGSLQTNCYLVTDEETQKTLIIDPGDEADFITTTILENKLVPQAILLTHGHYDHCLGVLELKLNFQIPIYLHPADLFLYQNAHQSAQHWSPVGVVPRGRPQNPPVDHFISDNQILPFGNSSLQVIHTPGHTPGSCCFLVSNVKSKIHNVKYLFTGDTLFATGIGSTDHKYSSKPDLQKSLHKLKSTFDDPQTTIYIYPGHEDYDFLLTSIQA